MPPRLCREGRGCPRSYRGGCRDALSLSRGAGKRSGNPFLAFLSVLTAPQPHWDILLPAGSPFWQPNSAGLFCPARSVMTPRCLLIALSVHSGGVFCLFLVFLTNAPHPCGPEIKFLICQIIQAQISLHGRTAPLKLREATGRRCKIHSIASNSSTELRAEHSTETTQNLNFPPLICTGCP